MATNNVQTHSGNRIIVRLDGFDVGLVKSIRTNDDYGHEPASGIGDIHVVEHVPAMAGHTIQVSQMVLKRTNLRRAGITEINGDGVLNGKVFDIVEYDKDTGAVMRQYTGCSYVSGSVSVEAHRIVTAEATFKAIDVVGSGY